MWKPSETSVCKAFIEQDPVELENIKQALLFMLPTEEMLAVEKRPGLKPN
jgi:hypothetical protein